MKMNNENRLASGYRRVCLPMCCGNCCNTTFDDEMKLLCTHPEHPGYEVEEDHVCRRWSDDGSNTHDEGDNDSFEEILIPGNLAAAIREMAPAYNQNMQQFSEEAIHCSIMAGIEACDDGAEIYDLCERYNLWSLWKDGGEQLRALLISGQREMARINCEESRC